jgi:hypothetical protein
LEEPAKEPAKEPAREPAREAEEAKKAALGTIPPYVYLLVAVGGEVGLAVIWRMVSVVFEARLEGTKRISKRKGRGAQGMKKGRVMEEVMGERGREKLCWMKANTRA